MMKHLFVVITVFSLVAGASAVDFPGTDPGTAAAQTDGSVYTLSNQVIAVSFRVSGGQLVIDSIEDKVAGQVYPQSVVSPVFKMRTSTAGLLSDWVVASGPTMAEAMVNTNSPSNGKHVPGKIIQATLTSATGGVSVDWYAELRDGSGYVRSVVDFQGDGTTSESFSEIELLCDLEIDPEGAQQIGDVKDAVNNQDRDGEVVRSGGMFFGVEMPFYWNDLSNNRIRGGLTSTLSLAPGNNYSFSAVMGVYPEGQLRRAFLHYNNRERARSYKPFLHYNCWYDFATAVNETDMLDRINTIHDELAVQRGVTLDSYVVDDGYDDYSAATGGFWAYDGVKFRNGFTPLATRLGEIGSNLGIWISPGGGYGGNAERFARGQEELGPSFTAWDMSIPAYYTWWHDRHVGHVQNDRANYFKWDQLGSSASGHFMKLMQVAHAMRSINPEVFINTTVGTWQSPFWLNQIDCTWRGEADVGFQGEGDEREQWNTYRDRSAWNRMTEAGQIYPLNALMVHGIVFGTKYQAAQVALGKTDLRNEARSYFGAGYALQELYLTPSTLGASQWDALAESALWAKDKADILVDSHFIGPSPAENKVYGFAAWQNNEGAITLRNPSSATKSFELDVGAAFELPEGAARAYVLQSPYADQRVQTLAAAVGRPVSVELQPFEVLVFDATPDADNIYAVLDSSEPKGTAPQTIRFDVSGSIDATRITRYELDCDGDGTIDSTGGGMSMFTFTNTGTYAAALTVFDATNGYDTITKAITISEASAPMPIVYLSDLIWVSDSVGYGSGTQKDKSTDGNPLILNGTTYAKGLGTHAQSQTIYALSGGFTTFHSVIGVDDEMLDDNPYAHVAFKVYGDNVLLYESAILGPTSAPVTFDLDVTGVQSLKLVVEDGGNQWGDHADWADAYIVSALSSFAVWIEGYGLSDDPVANDDSDQLNNFAEYALGLNPLIDDAAGAITFAVDGSGAQYRFLATASNVNFTVEYSTDLVTWLPYNGELLLDGSHFQVNVPLGMASPAGTLFLRLRLSE